MRIVAGKYRHRLIEYPNDMEHTRPTKDRIREAIFSAVGDICNSIVIDLYAGSGAMGIEALSREAKKTYFVDISSLAIKTIKNNLSSLNIDKNDYEVLMIKDITAIEYFNKNNIQADLIILDPPYALGEYNKIIELLKENNILNKNSIIVCESNKKLLFNIEEYSKIKEYHYGDIYVTILWR